MAVQRAISIPPTAKEGKIPLLWWVGGGRHLPPLTHRKRGENPSFVVGGRGKRSPPPSPPSPTAKEGPTPYKGWALQQGGQSPFSPQLKTNSPPSPPLHSHPHVFSCGNRNAWNHRPQSHPGQQAITTLYKQDSSTSIPFPSHKGSSKF